MKFSVIIPIYKAEAYLEKAVRSVLNQTYSDYEIILIDDGSPDKCPLMCDRYSAVNPKIRTIHQQNAGVSIARNKVPSVYNFGGCVVFFTNEGSCSPSSSTTNCGII